jgi:hypothetical protein
VCQKWLKIDKLLFHHRIVSYYIHEKE